jgi:hypothetical protein
MSPSLPRGLALFPLLLLALACDRRTEPFVDLAHEPPKVDRPVHVPGLEAPAPRAQMPMGSRGTAGGSDAAGGAPIRGSVVAGDGVAASGEGVLFVIARNGPGGPPLAVKRLPVGPFPLAFEVGASDVMMAGRPFAGPITLTARVDRDGDPLTHTPDEPSAELAAPVEPGAEGVELRLERPGAAASRPQGGAGTQEPANAAPIRGEIVAGEGVTAGGDGVLFVIARNGAGPPLAVKRLPVGPFPLAFELGPADVMMPGRTFAGPITLTARVDRDGDPMTRTPDEPSAALEAPLEPGATGVELRLELPKAN